MKNTLYIIGRLFLPAMVVVMSGCVRRPLDYANPTMARIPVRIDWSESNIPVSPADPTGGGAVHRVALRFYPEDGSEVFERYLEGNIFEGTVEVPIGRYKVIVMNESVEDVNYWGGAITFSDPDDFDRFSATVDPLADAALQQRFPFYTPDAGENIIVEPLRLASWSLGDLEVTGDMVRTSYEIQGFRAVEQHDIDYTDELGALSNIVMRRLTYNVTVTAHMTNLISVAANYTAAKGFSNKVYMASGLTEQAPSTYLFLLNGRVWDANMTDGTTTKTFLSFGRLPGDTAPAGTYRIGLDILLTDGEIYQGDDGPMEFDVTNQVLESTNLDIDLFIPEPGQTIVLPLIEGSITIGEWEDEVIDLQ